MADGSLMAAGGDMFLIRALFDQPVQIYRCDGWTTEGHSAEIIRWRKMRRDEEAWPIRIKGELKGFAALADTVGRGADLLHEIRVQHADILKVIYGTPGIRFEIP